MRGDVGTDHIPQVRANAVGATFFERVAGGAAAGDTLAIAQIGIGQQQAVIGRSGFLGHGFAAATGFDRGPVDRIGGIFGGQFVCRMGRHHQMAELGDGQNHQHRADDHTGYLVKEEIAHGRPQNH